MFRLSDRALEILRIEVHKCAGDDPVGKVQKDIVLKRLERLRSQTGSPASLAELQEAVKDIFPNFSDKALQLAIKANKPPGVGIKLLWPFGLAISSLGLIWIANLPYPMIRWPVAKTAPILLLPSYISMDYNYRQALALVEQADQLVNQSTSPEDFTLGAEKVKQAQKHLDALPVWFLGYSPQLYCRWMTCSWQFTLDEFQSARANVARMEAKLFQEKNANTSLTEADKVVNAAEQQYKQAATLEEREKAIASWQTSLDQLDQIASATLAGKSAQKKLEAYRQNFKQTVGRTTDKERVNTFIEAASQFANQAAIADQNLPHTVAEWENIENLWKQAISRLEEVSTQDLTGYTQAQKTLAQYTANLGQVKVKKQAEYDSVSALQQAQEQIERLVANANFIDRYSTVSQLQAIITQLEKVQKFTTAYPKAQDLLVSAQSKLKQMR